MSEDKPAGLILPLSSLAILVSSFLLFALQPAVTKIFLPIFGGSPGVWNICAMFFQIMLLGGYALTHFLHRAGSKWETTAYILVLALALCFLPIGLSNSWSPAWEAGISLNLLTGLFLTAGVPFFVVAMASPLIQRWFSYSTHHSAHDPYFLYALSNAGSLAALITYPFLVEPLLTLDQQFKFWSLGFIIFAISMVVLRLNVGIGVAGHQLNGKIIDVTGVVPTSNHTKLLWIVLAFIPSSFSLGVTQHLSTDVAAFPLLWIVPLALYLLSFIAAFSKSASTVVRFAELLFPWCLIPPILLLTTGLQQLLIAQIVLHLFAFFVSATCAHARLSSLRPAPSRLTEFYLYLSIGGALGGVFNSLIAPLIFNGVYEYPLAIALSCIFAWPNRSGTKAALFEWRKLVPSLDDLYVSLLAVSLLICAAPVLSQLQIRESLGGFSLSTILEVALPGSLLLASVFNKRRFICMALMLMIFPYLGLLNPRQTILTERTFFGVLRVQKLQRESGYWNQLWHGSTLHGMQYSSAPLDKQPSTYYAPSSPIGRVLTSKFADERIKNVAIVGLGIGTLAPYGRPQWNIDYYEIDPAVVRIANNVRYFNYLKRTAAKINFIVGDARVKLREAQMNFYDVLVIDAFSSDAIPIHLITLEAIDTYLAKTRNDGMLALHVTNRYLNLVPIVATISKALKVSGVACEDYNHTPEEIKGGKYGSKWIFLSRSDLNLGLLNLPSDNCSKLIPIGERTPWTDQFSNVFEALK